MNISYTRIGDYLLPNLKLEEKEQYSIGKYGLLKLEYLKKNNRWFYTKLLINNELNSYLYEVDKLVNDKINELIIVIAEKENVNESLKNTNQMLWIGYMNNIKNRAEEIILKDYIYGDLIWLEKKLHNWWIFWKNFSTILW